MDPRSEVVLRQQEFLSGSVLLVNAPCDELNTQLIGAVEPHFWTWNFNELQYFQNQQSDVHFGNRFAWMSLLIKPSYLFQSQRADSIMSYTNWSVVWP